MRHHPYRDRAEAGRVLASLLTPHTNAAGGIVLALPRGGVPVAFEVAKALHLPLDVFLVRKLGVPGHEELAMGAIASGGIRVVNDDVMESLGLTEDHLKRVAMRESAEIERRERIYRGDRPLPALEGREVILIDDGLATGATMRAAARASRMQQPSRLTIAVPVGARSSCAEMKTEADEVVCAIAPDNFQAVGFWYDDFRETTDDEVKSLLVSSHGGTERDGDTE
jgi:putative phosphoribosyl transferase